VTGPAPAAIAEAILGHSFAQPGLLHEALTHRSAAHRQGGKLRRGDRRGVGSNERLEFIGDRVLGLLMAEWLIERFPLEQEGSRPTPGCRGRWPSRPTRPVPAWRN